MFSFENYKTEQLLEMSLTNRLNILNVSFINKCSQLT